MGVTKFRHELPYKYFSNSSILPVYSLTNEEKACISEFMLIYKNWDKNKVKITNLLKEINLDGLNTTKNLNNLLYECIYKKYQVYCNGVRYNII